MQTLVAQSPGPETSALDQEPDIPDFPTPFFFFDLAQLSDNLAAFKAALPGFRFFYAMKCNPQRSILETLARSGSAFEIASAAELSRLNDLHIAGDEILFSNPVKAPATYELRARRVSVALPSTRWRNSRRSRRRPQAPRSTCEWRRVALEASFHCRDVSE